MRVRLGAAGAAAAVCIAVGLLLVSTATSAAPPASKARRTAVLAGKARPTAHLAAFSGNYAQGTIVNLTPYTWTFVDDGGIGSDTHPQPRFSKFPDQLTPGQDFVYSLNYTSQVHLTTWSYDGWFTYKADTLNGPEYLSVFLEGEHCTGACSGSEVPLAIQAYNTTAAPMYDRNGLINFGANTSNPEISWTSGGTTDVYPCFLCSPHTADFDYTFETKGTFNIDASKLPSNRSGALADVLNGLCQNTTNSCTFTPTSQLTFKPGKLTQYTDEPNCSTNAQGQEPLPAAERDVTVTEERDSTITAGGSATVGLEVSVFEVVEAGISAKFGIEHEWTDDTMFSKTVKIFVPSGWVGVVWIAPEVGSVTGTMVLKTSTASYTFTNLNNTKSGVQPDLLTPPYNLIFDARPMTPTERQQACPSGLKAVPAPIGGRG